MKKSVIPTVEIKKDSEGNPVMETMRVSNSEQRKETALTHPVLFISEYKGLSVSDSEGIVCRFSPFAVNHPTYGQISKGQYACHTKETFDRLIEHPAMDKSYMVVRRLPRETDRSGNVLRREGTGGQGRRVHELNDADRGMYRQLIHLQAQYFTKDSNYTEFKGNVKSEGTKDRVMKQIDSLQRKLNLEEV